MDDDDRPRPRGPDAHLGAASQLAGESLDRYSIEELDQRIALLKAEIARIQAHRASSSAHRLAAEALFKPKAP